MEKSKVLLLVEGEKVEKELFEHFFHLYGLHNVQIVSYKTNIYAFYHRLKKDYANTQGEIEYEFIDLPLFLNDYLGLQGEELLNESDFKERILIFDFDPHDPQYSSEKLIELIVNFSNSTELGKLYLNYPMVESFKDITSFTEGDFLAHVVHIDTVRNRIGKTSEYKRFVDQRSCIKKIPELTKQEANALFQLHSKKFAHITKKDSNDSLSESHKLLCTKQCEKLAGEELIWVINTSLLHLFDEYGEIK